MKNNFGLILIDKNKKALNNQKRKINKIKHSASLIIFNKDITKETHLKYIFNFLKKRKIHIYSLINNAAIDAKPKSKNTDKSILLKGGTQKYQ